MVIPVSERPCPEFRRNPFYLPGVWLNRKKLFIFSLKKPPPLPSPLPGLEQAPLVVEAHSSLCVVQPSSPRFGWAPGKGHTTEREPYSSLCPASDRPACGPGGGRGFTASRPLRCMDKPRLGSQGPVSIPRWCQQLTVVVTLRIPSEAARDRRDSSALWGSVLTSLPRPCFSWIHPRPLHVSGKLS